MNPHCDLDLEVSTLIFPHNTPSQDDSPPHKFAYKWFSGSGDIIQPNMH